MWRQETPPLSSSVSASLHSPQGGLDMDGSMARTSQPSQQQSNPRNLSLPLSRTTARLLLLRPSLTSPRSKSGPSSVRLLSRKNALLGVVLLVSPLLTSCALFSRQTSDARVPLVCGDGATEPCKVSIFLIPEGEMAADHAAALAKSARKELKACDRRHDAVIRCINKHNLGE